MATNVYFSKKAKAKMKARRNRLRKSEAERIGHEDADNQTDNTSSSHARKRPASEMTSSSDAPNGNKTADSNIITVPAGLNSKEARKFRKDARRRARANGQPDDQLKFIVEGQEQEKVEGKSEQGQQRKRPKKEAPKISELLARAAEQKKLEEKRAKQNAINDAIPLEERSQYVAIDCEMVGVGIGGKKSALARASAVGWSGEVLFDTFVRVPERVTDFRTRVSGVRARDINSRNDEAMDHEECRTAVGELLMGKKLVGHALKNDLAALMITHPREEIRDTARYKPFMRATGRSGGKLRPRKLRDLVLENLGMKIQVEGESHCSIDDARASMELFKSVKGQWEKELAAKSKTKRGTK
ncbi:hypothetical protein THAOC_13115 [Thalassiosira oceanica]|uniref:RNA exonuclease 4 n=1 Tax=Thalassiosira oceanica TaxID=159749 RepID=K0SLY3_THAOC|nr:hypothetical protein THAOC_13115 [Thalassiosira oceanica]|mmetsp:Transcript_23753/g.53922  ORF Transcript_23753/g.53922 Transcript_23753/m.53922 type:complete len:357 (-) Transcript_23753:1131-2201(-)|eukprot:EJK65984.1 hypothetical protein THAOC_13115 [Thalassiosira oceanica]